MDKPDRRLITDAMIAAAKERGHRLPLLEEVNLALRVLGLKEISTVQLKRAIKEIYGTEKPEPGKQKAIDEILESYRGKNPPTYRQLNEELDEQHFSPITRFIYNGLIGTNYFMKNERPKKKEVIKVNREKEPGRYDAVEMLIYMCKDVGARLPTLKEINDALGDLGFSEIGVQQLDAIYRRTNRGVKSVVNPIRLLDKMPIGPYLNISVPQKPKPIRKKKKSNWVKNPIIEGMVDESLHLFEHTRNETVRDLRWELVIEAAKKALPFMLTRLAHDVSFDLHDQKLKPVPALFVEAAVLTVLRDRARERRLLKEEERKAVREAL